jgi:hypothetical protein
MVAMLRYNHNSKTEFDKWRLIVNGQEHIASEVVFLCPTKTTIDEIEIDGQIVTKYHVSALDMNRMYFEYGGQDFTRIVIN